MKTKRGAIIDGCSGKILSAAMKIEDLFLTRGVDLVITEGMPTIKHRALRSAHNRGDALDIRSKTLLTLERKKDLLKAIKRRLGPAYVVLLESIGKPWEHYHVHWSPTHESL
ncbi:hypothetical protein KAR91_54350 [Candidatus Pacearchaeota archaeon]|nr:hypothetical protein [Candidatus Pacearchaeota archaeon]